MNELYDPSEPGRVQARARASALLARYNRTSSGDPARIEILGELFGRVGPGTVIEPPFHCDYGSNIAVGERFYANAGCVFLDCASVTIGDLVKLGPHVQLLAVSHPLDRAQRATGLEYGAPISIGDEAWLGGGAIVLPGVTIGEGAVVGAGSVVTRDVEPETVVAGNPARPLRRPVEGREAAFHDRGFRAFGNGNQRGMKRTRYALLGWVAWRIGKHRIRRKVRAVARWD